MFYDGKSHMFEDIISPENLLAAWREFVAGKRGKKDVQAFQAHLMDNVLALARDLERGQYKHGAYEAFKVNDPKPRDIHKASVRDRLLHHAVYRVLYPYFDRHFIADSYSCRIGKGTHRAMERFKTFGRKVSKNGTATCWVLKCDVRKFFASIDQELLYGIVEKRLEPRVVALLDGVVGSFSPGLPLGNLTSQLLVNVYMNEFDQYVKHRLRVRYYIRYADDFVLMSESRPELERLLGEVRSYLTERLRLSLHPHKVHIATLSSGIDFLGWVHFPTHRVLRTSTKRRMLRTLAAAPTPERVESYKGLLTHGDAHGLSTRYLDSRDIL